MIRSYLKVVFVVFSLTVSNFAAAATLNKFCSDGCTMAPSGIFDEDEWKICCIRHDYEYWKGGDEADKETADQKFYSCMKSRAGEDIAQTYYDFVSAFGESSWSGGWEDRPKFKKLTREELALVERVKPANPDTEMCDFQW